MSYQQEHDRRARALVAMIHGGAEADPPVIRGGRPNYVADVDPRGREHHLAPPDPDLDEPGWGPSVEVDASALWPWLRSR